VSYHTLWHSSDLEINWHLTSSHWIFYYLVFWIPFYSGQHYLMIAVPQMTFYSGTSQMLKRLHWSHCVPDHCHNNHPNLFRSLKHHFHHISHLLMADFHLVNYLSHSHQSIFTTEAIYWWLTTPWWITWAILINLADSLPFTIIFRLLTVGARMIAVSARRIVQEHIRFRTHET
jgi:hypothetical protein